MAKSGQRLTCANVRALFSPVRMLIISGCSFFISAGRLDLPRGWLYYALALSLSLGGGLFLLWRSPGLLTARGEMGEDTDSRDKVVLLLFFAANLVLLPAVAGFDAGRFNRPLLPGFYIYAGVVFHLIASATVFWAMLKNPFFEGTVRLQEDRGQVVVSSGPYRYIRHPGYLGMAMNTLPLPLIAGSGAAMVPALLAIAIIVLRTALEDRFLLEQLPGYRDYSRKVRYRLLPLIW